MSCELCLTYSEAIPAYVSTSTHRVLPEIQSRDLSGFCPGLSTTQVNWKAYLLSPAGVPLDGTVVVNLNNLLHPILGSPPYNAKPSHFLSLPCSALSPFYFTITIRWYHGMLYEASYSRILTRSEVKSLTVLGSQICDLYPPKGLAPGVR